MLFLTESQTKPDGIILCSLSPYFIEDYKNLKPVWIKFWRTSFKNELTFKSLSDTITSKLYLIAGGKEHTSLLKRSRSLKRKVEFSKLRIANGAGHNIDAPTYLDLIKKYIEQL